MKKALSQRSQNSVGTRIRHLKALRKSPWKFINGRMIHITQYVAGLSTSGNISIADNKSVKGGLKVIDCIVLSAE